LTSSTTLKGFLFTSGKGQGWIRLSNSPPLLDGCIARGLNAALDGLRHDFLRVHGAFDLAVGDLLDFRLLRAFGDGSFVLRDDRRGLN
jgi:hypothetical protein